MLGRTAGGIFWMFRYLERSENIARLAEAGFHIALTRSAAAEAEWSSIVTTAGVRDAFLAEHARFDAAAVINYLLRDRTNPSSVMAVIEMARTNARAVRTALTQEVWEATNECWMTLKDALARTVHERDLPSVLALIRQQNALVRGAVQGTMFRNDIYNFARLGTFLERADNTARILDVKYYVLLPSISYVGSSLDNVQWETILRSVSAHRSYNWLNEGNLNPKGIAEFLILDRSMPRSLVFCYNKIVDSLGYIAADYRMRHDSHEQAERQRGRLHDNTIDMIFDDGLHEFIGGFIQVNNQLGRQIEQDYRFSE
ncbi:MAG: alpha-E domain-containing protein [Geminicoccaceae bacterium]